MFWFAFFLLVFAVLAWRRTPLREATWVVGGAVLVYGIFGQSAGVFLLLLLLFAAIAIPLNVREMRQEWLIRPAMEFMRKVLPEISRTEQQALDAGTVWWDGELFSGDPDWSRLAAMPRPRLSEQEQAFLDGPVREFCAMLDEWDITAQRRDLPPEAWDFLKRHRFFGLIIPRRYGGLEFSAFAHSQILARISSSPGGATAGSIVAVPNSLGPAELLLHYGTEEQKDYYLPRLATGEEIPCFGLTSPWAGSDAGAIPDHGVVCRGTWNGEEVLGMRLNFDKRYITLAPVATVVGLAFRLYDPDHLLGDEEDIGITCALIPRDTPGLEIGARHLPLDNPFMNGPVRGKDVFVPLEFIIGGPKMAGQGWRMLMECLAVGRSISLPSNSTGNALMCAATTGAYARIRRQFGLPIGQFEGVAEALAAIGGLAYAADSTRRFTAHAVDLGEKPSVPSAIAKLHCTEMAQRALKLAMDVHAGKGVMLGPRNWIARAFEGSPIAITVEGANILTRNMIVFGQGAIRCHPYVLREIRALQDPDPDRALDAFDAALTAHVGHVISSAVRSLGLALSGGRLASVPAHGPTRRHLQRIARYSAHLALLADAAMALLGGSLKFRERLSARLGDLLAALYIASAAIKRFEDDGSHPDDVPLLDWVCEQQFAAAELAIDGFLRNLPNRFAAAALRLLVLPLGVRARGPDDRTEAAVAETLMEPNPTLERLLGAAFLPQRDDAPVGQLHRAWTEMIACEDLLQRVQKAARSGMLRDPHPIDRVAEAVAAGVLSREEGERLRACLEQVAEVCRVDEFAPEALAGPADAAPARKPAKRKATGRGKAARPGRRKARAAPAATEDQAEGKAKDEAEGETGQA